MHVRVKILATLAFLGILTGGVPMHARAAAPTPYWINLYSIASTYRGQAIRPGTVVNAYDPQGVLCGKATVPEPGVYGFLACYFDDPNTAEDEGIRPGDTVVVTFNGQFAGSVLVPMDVVNGQRMQGDFHIDFCYDTYEPDDTLADSHTLTGPETRSFSTERYGADQDWVKFPARAGWTYQITAHGFQPLSLTQPLLRLYSAGGALLAENALDKWGRGAEIWWWNDGGDQEVYIQVVEANGHIGCLHYYLMLFPWSPGEMRHRFGQ
jgi:hypothetical protein